MTIYLSDMIRHLGINIESLLKWYEVQEVNIFSADDGHQLAALEAWEEIPRFQNLGHKLIPSADCEVFNPFGKGCPG